MINEFTVIGCDGSFCADADTQEAYPLDDTNIAFCRVCWSREMQRRRSSGKDEVLLFPGKSTSTSRACHSVVAYLSGTGSHGNAGVEKIRRTRPTLYDEE